MGKARAEIEITASSSKLASGLSAAARRFHDFASSVARGTAATFKGMQDGLSKLRPGHTMSTAIGTFGGSLLSKFTDHMMEAGKGVLDFNRNLVRFQITGNMTKAETEKLGETIRQISKDTAISSSEVLAGGASYVALTGDVKGAKDAMSSFARIAQATGSSTSDIATAAAALKTSLKIKPDDFEKVFSVLASQGKAGAVELKDFAAELSGLAPSFAQFGKMGDGVEGVRELGAAMQVMRTGFGSANEAATGFRSMLAGLVKHAKDFEAAGVHIFDVGKGGVKTMRNFSDIWHDINKSKLVNNPTLLEKAFGRDEARRAYDQLKMNTGMYDQMIEAGHEYGTIGADFDTYMQSSAGRIDAAWNKAKETMAEVFTPDRMETLAEVVEAAAQKLSDLFQTLSEFKDFIEGKDAAAQNPYEAKADDQENTLLGILSGFASGGASMQGEKQALAVGTNAALSNASREPGSPDWARTQEANRVAFNDTWHGIDKAGDRTQRVRAAVEAAYGTKYGLAAGPGQEGRESAALRYIGQKDNIKADEVNKIRDELKQSQQDGKQLVDTLKASITDAIKAGFAGTQPATVKLGDNQVAQSVKKADIARRAP